jgi:hypothetical protein
MRGGPTSYSPDSACVVNSMRCRKKQKAHCWCRSLSSGCGSAVCLAASRLALATDPVEGAKRDEQVARTLPIGPGGPQSGFSFNTPSPQVCIKGLSQKKNRSADYRIERESLMSTMACRLTAWIVFIPDINRKKGTAFGLQ